MEWFVLRFALIYKDKTLRIRPLSISFSARWNLLNFDFAGSFAFLIRPLPGPFVVSFFH
jgi:hypothetical protein